MRDNHEKETEKRTWKYRIRELMKDFKFSKEEINYVIKSTKSEVKKDATDDQMYSVAWRKFKGMLDMPKSKRKMLVAS